MVVWTMFEARCSVWEETTGSSIIADYLLSFQYYKREGTIFINLFIKKDDTGDFYVPVSYFPSSIDKTSSLRSFPVKLHIE